jgi:hypothetical protein
MPENWQSPPPAIFGTENALLSATETEFCALRGTENGG